MENTNTPSVMEDITILDDKNLEPVFSLNEIHNGLSYLLGCILTVVDATQMNERQAKAMKDVIKKDVWGAYNTYEESAELQRQGKTPPLGFKIYAKGIYDNS